MIFFFLTHECISVLFWKSFTSTWLGRGPGLLNRRVWNPREWKGRGLSRLVRASHYLSSTLCCSVSRWARREAAPPDLSCYLPWRNRLRSSKFLDAMTLSHWRDSRAQPLCFPPSVFSLVPVLLGICFLCVRENLLCLSRPDSNVISTLIFWGEGIRVSELERFLLSRIELMPVFPCGFMLAGD